MPQWTALYSGASHCDCLRTSEAHVELHTRTFSLKVFQNIAFMSTTTIHAHAGVLFNASVPCSESVEMVEPMLSVRMRSTDPDTESCSRRRLR